MFGWVASWCIVTRQGATWNFSSFMYLESPTSHGTVSAYLASSPRGQPALSLGAFFPSVQIAEMEIVSASGLHRGLSLGRSSQRLLRVPFHLHVIMQGTSASLDCDRAPSIADVVAYSQLLTLPRSCISVSIYHSMRQHSKALSDCHSEGPAETADCL